MFYWTKGFCIESDGDAFAGKYFFINQLILIT